MQAQACLSTLICYFIVVGITYIATEAANTEAVCQYAVVLMGGNAARCMDRLEIQGNSLNSFLEFEKPFINQYTQLDNTDIARDILCKFQQCG